MFPPSFSAASQVITVAELNRTARNLLEQAIPLIWVGGEISNLVQAASGHWYFSLKDEKAQVRCVMFRHKNQYLDFKPENGMQVEVRALVTLYEPRGEFQVNVETMRRAGLGALFEAFEKLKARLEQEGLFDASRKKPLPAFPLQIGVITSPAAAALRDVLSTLRRRMPSLPVIIYPTPVQGEGAAAQIVQAIRRAGKRGECSVLILCRGGGSIEDLWQFNQESVARAIAECPLPLVCGVGHETDFTIADFVADRRAPTPTAAAEMTSPNRIELLQKTTRLQTHLQQITRRMLEARMQHLDHLSRRLLHPGEQLKNQGMHVQHLQQRLQNAFFRSMYHQQWRMQCLGHRLQIVCPDTGKALMAQRVFAQRLQRALVQQLANSTAALQRLEGNLQHLNPQSVLERGYSIVQMRENLIVRDSAQIQPGDPLRITFAHGWSEAQVTKKG